MAVNELELPEVNAAIFFSRSFTPDHAACPVRPWQLTHQSRFSCLLNRRHIGLQRCYQTTWIQKFERVLLRCFIRPVTRGDPAGPGFNQHGYGSNQIQQSAPLGGTTPQPATVSNLEYSRYALKHNEISEKCFKGAMYFATNFGNKILQPLLLLHNDMICALADFFCPATSVSCGKECGGTSASYKSLLKVESYPTPWKSTPNTKGALFLTTSAAKCKRPCRLLHGIF